MITHRSTSLMLVKAVLLSAGSLPAQDAGSLASGKGPPAGMSDKKPVKVKTELCLSIISLRGYRFIGLGLVDTALSNLISDF